ncbi:MAG: DUF512 domain-containing protein [Clostridia bacterium]|nr:DUF512 domain-containing protein [Clostridia bacterium]
MHYELKEKIIKCVDPGSPAERAGLKAGDAVAAVSGHELVDIFDYRYYIADANPEVTAVRPDGTEFTAVLEKEEYEDAGIEFENPMLAKDRHCANSCIFCFIDQMPPGMRDTLYFKDDDLRLSFLTGSYVTLTNCTMQELKRLAGYHISPVNVSIHTMNPELRVRMLGHRGAGDIAEKLKVLLDAGITVNGQIVLVPGWNDGAELKFTLDSLLALPENFNSVSVVPVGLTRYREGLCPLRPFTEKEALETVRLIEDYRQMARIMRGNSFVYASDEFYVKAGLPLPGEDEYDGFPSLEDGVGMLRLLESEVSEVLEDREAAKKLRRRLFFKRRRLEGTLATGEIAYGKLKEVAEKVADFARTCGKKPDFKVKAIRNDFFGSNVTVSGLITGRDLIDQLKESGVKKGDRVLITVNMLKAGERVFLDDITVDEAEKELGARIVAVGKTGADFVEALLFG